MPSLLPFWRPPAMALANVRRDAFRGFASAQAEMSTKATPKGSNATSDM